MFMQDRFTTCTNWMVVSPRKRRNCLQLGRRLKYCSLIKSASSLSDLIFCGSASRCSSLVVNCCFSAHTRSHSCSGKGPLPKVNEAVRSDIFELNSVSGLEDVLCELLLVILEPLEVDVVPIDDSEILGGSDGELSLPDTSCCIGALNRFKCRSRFRAAPGCFSIKSSKRILPHFFNKLVNCRTFEII